MPKGVWDRSKTKEQREAEKAGKSVKTTAKAVAKTVKAAAPKAAKVTKAPKKVELGQSTGIGQTGSASGKASSTWDERRERVELMLDVLTTATSCKQNGAGAAGLDRIIEGATERLQQELNGIIALLPVAPAVAQVEPEEKEELEEAEEEELPPVNAGQVAAPLPAPTPMAAPVSAPVAIPAPVPFNNAPTSA